MRAPVTLAALALAAGCATGPGLELPLPAPPPPSAPSNAPPASALEREIHALVNQHRARARRPPLQLDDRISALAREHSRAMAQRRRPFGHDGFEERAAALSRIVAVRGLAENVAYDSRTGAALAPSVASGWIASPRHRENLEGEYDLTGIGAATAPDGTTYVTQLFVQR